MDLIWKPCQRCQPKNSGIWHPKMDGLFHGKPLFKMGWFGGKKNPIFLETSTSKGGSQSPRFWKNPGEIGQATHHFAKMVGPFLDMEKYSNPIRLKKCWLHEFRIQHLQKKEIYINMYIYIFAWLAQMTSKIQQKIINSKKKTKRPTHQQGADSIHGSMTSIPRPDQWSLCPAWWHPSPARKKLLQGSGESTLPGSLAPIFSAIFSYAPWGFVEFWPTMFLKKVRIGIINDQFLHLKGTTFFLNFRCWFWSHHFFLESIGVYIIIPNMRPFCQNDAVRFW